MTTLNDAYISALLADASYVDNFVPELTGTALANRLAGRMTPVLAKYIGDNFKVVEQVSGTNSSFDATVWRGNDGTPYAGQVYVSMRGTQELPDFAADGDLLATGLAHRQLVDMVNWWLRATTPAHYEDGMSRFVSQISLSEDDDFVAGNSALATGTLADVEHIVAVNGHSLGGYLATSFARLFGSKWPIGTVDTFNSAGFSKQSAANIENGFGQIAKLIGPELGRGNFSNAQNNLFALNGVNVTTNTWDPVGFQQYGARTGLFQEDSVQLVPDVGTSNHSMYKLTDLLALGYALAQLDPTVDFGRLSLLARAGSNQMAASYEGVLDGLRRLVMGVNVNPTLIGDASAGNAGPQPDARIDFHDNIKALTDNPEFKSLLGNMSVSEVGSHLASQAKVRVEFDEIAALISLSPFVVGAQNTDGRRALGSLWQSNKWNAQYEGWLADKASIQAGGEAENFTDQYLTDRALLLQTIVSRNVQDISGSIVGSNAARTDRVLDVRYFEPGNSAVKNLTIWNPLDNGGGNALSSRPHQLVVFGGEGDDPLIGTNDTGGVDAKFGDHIYGGGGNDVIDGLDGDDYLDGGTGNDAIDGGKGFDTIVGGAGDDTFNGREDNDLIVGGAGNDTYQFTGSFGLDNIRDSDGKGTITVDSGPALAGGRKLADNVWESGDKAYAYTQAGDNLVIIRRSATGRAPGGIITVQGWKQGQLGITLSNESVPQTATTTSYIGDFAKRKNPDGTQYVLGEDGQYVADGAQTNAPDLITGTGGADLIQGLGGDDALLGGEDDDVLEGGDGNDVIMGGKGADTIKGGAGGDLIYGSSTGSLQYPTSTSYQLVETSYPVLLGEGFNWRLTSPLPDSDGYTHGFLSGTVVRDTQSGDKGNIIDAGTGDDIIYAGTGNDVVHAGEDKDQIMGMAGDDVLFGDDGDDRIYGDGPSTSAEALVYTAPDQHCRDILVGGAGNDLLIGQGNDDALYGGDGSDVLYGDDRSETNTPLGVRGNDYLDGGTGNDVLYGNEGDDILIGGTGDDRLIGGTGRDIYVINRGDGQDSIDDTKSESNILRFGANVASSDVTLRLGSLMLDLGNGDSVHIGGFDQDDALNSVAIDSFEFTDGSVLSSDELLARGFDIDGSASDDSLRGTSVTDRMKGFGGNDALYGGTGDDTLDGGAGDDLLSGGSGNDTLNGGTGNDALAGGDGDDVYTFHVGDGHDSISDASGSDTITFAEGINLDSVTVNLTGDLLKLTYGTNDSVTIEGNVANYRFGDGTSVSGEQMRARIPQSGPADSIRIDGTAGADNLVGKTGNDYVLGGDGGDVIDGGAGDDFLYGDAGNDTLHGGDGADSLAGGDGDDLLYGDAGLDRLWGNAGDDALYGGEGDDELTAGDGNDLLVGGRGDDLLTVDGGGVNTYQFELGDGVDVLVASPAARHIRFGAGIAPGDIKMYLSPSDSGRSYVRVQYSSDDSLMVQLGPNAGTLDYRFADGSLISQASLAVTAAQTTPAGNVMFGTSGDDNLNVFGQAALLEGGAGKDRLTGSWLNDELHGGSGDDVLDGGGGDDVLEGGAGNDTLQGGGGRDTYLYAKGGGSDVISEDGNPDDVNVLRLVDLKASDVTYTREASDSLLIHVRNSADTIEVKRWYGEGQTRVQQIVFADGAKADLAKLDSLTQVQIVGTDGDDTLTGTKYADIIVGGAGADTIDGAEANDTITGGDGADTYLIRREMGLDTIQETAGAANILRCATGLTFDQLVTQRQGSDLYVHFTASRDGVLLKDYYAGVDNWVVKSDTGEQKSMAQVIADNNTRPVALTVEQLRTAWIAQAKIALLQSYGEDASYSSFAHWYTSPYSLAVNYPNLGHFTYGFSEVAQQSDAAVIERASNETDYALTGESTTVAMSVSYPLVRYTAVVESGKVVVLDLGGTGPSGLPDRITYDWSNTQIVTSSDKFTVTGTVQMPSQAISEILEHIVAGPSNNVIDTWGMGTVDAGDGDDVIYHTSQAPYPPGQFLYGGAGNDTIFGFLNDDLLIGGDGDDYLCGSQGNDTYYLVWDEAGTKVIDEAAIAWQLPGGWLTWNDGSRYSVDTVEFGPGITLRSLQIQRGRYASPIDVGDNRQADETVYDTLDLQWGRDRSAQVLKADPATRWVSPDNDGYGIEFFKFADGTILTMAEMQHLADTRGNTLYLWSGDGARSLPLRSGVNSFTFDSGITPDRVIFSKDGSDLVVSDKRSFDQWRILDWYDNPANPSSFIASFEDGTVLSGTQIGPSNKDPIAVQPIPAQTVQEDSTWSFAVPSAAFADPDVEAGDTLTYGATLDSGTALPSWLSFDPSTRSFSGTPLNGDVGSVAINVTATDRAGTQAHSGFVLTVQNVNDAPNVTHAIASQDATEDQPWTFAVPAGTFEDVDGGDTLTYRATLGNGDVLPAWMSFDAATLTFSGTPSNGDVGASNLKITAVDRAGASASTTFALAVANVNDAPTAGAIAGDQGASETRSFSVQLPGNLFVDVDEGDRLSWNVRQAGGEPLPVWLTFDAATRILSGTPQQGDGGPLALRVTVTDAAGASASQAFSLKVNRLPTLALPVGAQSAVEDQPWILTIPAGTFVDIDPGDTLSYSATLADGTALPSWLAFSPESRAFKGTPLNADVGAVNLKVTATDAQGLSTSSQFQLAVANVNDAPQVAQPLANQTATEDLPWSFTVPVGTFSDVDAGDTLSYAATLASGAALPSWLSFSASARSFSGTPQNADVGDLGLTVVTTDSAGASASANFTVTVANVNDAPVAVGSLAAWSVVAGDAVSYTVPSTAFADVDRGDVLSYAGTVSTGAALPSWLAFNPATRMFNGTPAAGDKGDLVLKVSATDAGGLSAFQSVSLHVDGGLTLSGTSGADVLTGRAGNDYLDGGVGADRMAGGEGDDTYVVDSAGDVVTELATEGVDLVYAAITYTLPANVENLILVGSAQVVPSGRVPPGVTLPTLPANASAPGANGTGNDRDNVLAGNERKNTLTGGAGNDTLDGGAGDDKLIGGIGNDTYVLGRGYGTDTIVEDDSTAGNTDIARFADDIASNQLWFRKHGTDLEVVVIGTNDMFSLQDWYKGSRYHVEQFKAGDGKVLLDSQVQSLVDAMASFSPPAAGQTTLSPDYQRALGGVLAANWH